MWWRKKKWWTTIYHWSQTPTAGIPSCQDSVKMTGTPRYNLTVRSMLLPYCFTDHWLLLICLLPICCLLLSLLGLGQQLLPDSLQRLTALLCLLLQKIQHLFLPAPNAIHHHCRCTVNLPYASDFILKRPLFLLHHLHLPHHGFHLP